MDTGHSQNGFKVPPIALHGWVIPGTNETITLANNDAGFALAVHLLWFNEVVEPVKTKPFDDWGYDPDPKHTNIVGGPSLSNHDSGTAVDINATKHPFGVATADTFSSEHITVIRKRLFWLSALAGLYKREPMPAHWDSNSHPSIIRWGGDYGGKPDSMHWEANVGPGSEHWVTLTGELKKRNRGKRILAENTGAQAHG